MQPHSRRQGDRGDGSGPENAGEICVSDGATHDTACASRARGYGQHIAIRTRTGQGNGRRCCRQS